jgi:aspartyl-tRNA(Asn)/glutamyl-tRNA(Gln) amidotransferase subunit A
MTNDVAFLSLAEAGHGLRTGKLSAVQLVEACLARIEAREPQLHAFLHLDAAGAMRGAAQADRDIRAGHDRGAMHGIPVGIKDLFDVAGMPTTWNSALPRPPAPQRDAAVVENLRQNGAIVLGKLAAWECGIGGTSFGLPWPPARNPWALDREPGGSSSGSAAAVAAGFCFGAVGSDTGGSIREPASWCGITGLKPTFGLVPVGGGLAASFTLDHVGPMTRTVADCAAMLDAMVSGGSAERNLGAGVAALRIGMVDVVDAGVEPEVMASLENAAAILGRSGARLSSVRLPALDLFGAVATVIAAAEGYAVHRKLLAGAANSYDPLTRQRLLVGAAVKACDYVDAMDMRQRLIEAIGRLFLNSDLLVMPTTRTAAPPFGSFDSHGGHASLCRPWNVTGYPTLSLPSGFSKDGLPLAIQIVARPFEDEAVLRAGHALEAALGTHFRPPDGSVMPAALAAAAIPVAVDDEAAMEALARITERAAALVRGTAAVGF